MSNQTEPTDDVMTEERAFVSPEDASLLGGVEDTTEKIKTIEERAKVADHLGGSRFQALLRIFSLLAFALLGYWMSGGQMPAVGVPAGLPL